MAKQLSPEEVHLFDQAREVFRSLIQETLRDAGEQTKRWMGVWLGVVVVLTAILGIADAPPGAYAIPAIVLLLACASGLRCRPISGKDKTEPPTSI
jgi:hypothetical protein